jgi:DNA polymerase/3'-5' exonuclease PolX
VSKSDGRIPAAVAWKVADRLRERLAPTCSQFEIAGSLRRQKPTIGDVDIICVPVLKRLYSMTTAFTFLLITKGF